MEVLERNRQENDNYATDKFRTVYGPDISGRSHSPKTVSLIHFRNTLLIFSLSEARGSTKPNSSLKGRNYFVNWKRWEFCKIAIMTF